MDKNKTPPDFDRSFYGPKYWPTWIGLGCLYLLSFLPIWLAVKLGAGFGLLLYHVAPARRRIAEVNISLCFPELSEQQQQQLVRDTLRAIGINFFEFSIGLWGSFKKFRNHHQVTGLEYVKDAQSAGRGVLLIGAHFTTIDVSGRILSEYQSFDVLFRSDPNPLFDYMIKRARETFASDAIPRNDTRKMIKNLRQGHMIWYAPDQDYRTQHRVFAPFFGVPAATVIGTSRIARLGNAVVLPLSHYRDQQGCYHLKIHPPLEDFPSGDDLADATRINGIIEAAVREHPEQYLWVHRRFKTRPPGEAGFYPPKKKKKRKTEATN